MLYLLLLLPLFLYYHLKLRKIKEAKYKHYCKEKEVEIVYPRISIIIYCFSDDIEDTVKSINYIQNKYDIIPVKTLNNLENIINKNSKFTLIISNNMILTTDCIYDMIKFVIHNDLDSTHCLFSFPNYKDNFINNIYYHHRYLENMIDDNPIFGRLISSKEIKNFVKSKIKSDLLQKNLIVQNLPEILSIPSEIYFYDIYKINKFYLIEYFSFLIIFLNINISYILSFISIVFYYYYQASYLNFGINDFNFHGSFFLSIFKILSLPLTLLNFITFNYFTVKYPKLKYNSFIKPQYSDKVDYKYGYLYHLTNYNLDVVYLNGSHYQMGYTIGEMYKKELSESIKILDNYVANFLINPLWKNIGYKARDILEVVKEYSWEYISEETKDELKGISEGSNIDINEIILVSLLPSLSKAHCTILTDNNIFLRTLDVDLKGNRYAMFVYNNKYITVTLPGMIWCFTGFSRNIVIGEVFNDNCITSRNKFGSPFFFNFKDILLKSETLEEAKKLIEELKWHDSVDIGIRSMKDDKIMFIEKRGNDSIFYNNNNFNEYLEKYSNVKESGKKYSLYYNLDLIYSIINQYNKLTVNDSLNSIIIGLETGSNHSIIIDFKSNKLFLSNNDVKKEGYLRQMVEFEINNLYM